jgi:phosphate:Na+ symporter
VVGVALFLPFLGIVTDWARELQPDMAKMTAQFHIVFNVVLAAGFIALLDPLAWLLEKLLPARAKADDPSAPRYLDEGALDAPSLALADASREVLRMGDVVEVMLQKVMTALMTGNRALVAEVCRMDNTVDRLDEAIKLYIAKLTRGSLDEREGKRAMEIVSFTINLEHVGDIIDKNLSELAGKRIKRNIQFSAEGAAELIAFHKRVLDGLKLAFSVFMAGDIGDARKLIVEKTRVRLAELEAAEHHFERLRAGRAESIESTSLHLDVLRDLKRIHSHICSVAYPVLEAAGEMPANDVSESDPITLAVPGMKSGA